jgi:hypothetical protein
MGTVEQVGEKWRMGFPGLEELGVIMSVLRGKPPRRERFTDHASSMAVSSVDADNDI